MNAATLDCDLAVLGAGPGGYSAAFRGADLGLKTVLIERDATLGGVCLNVGCIPSKALLHVTGVLDAAASLSKAGVRFVPPEIDLGQLRTHKESIVAKLTNGLAAMAKARKVTVVRGTGTFASRDEIAVVGEGPDDCRIRFRNAVVAAGSEAIKLPFLPNDPRIIDSTGALELKVIPKRMLVIGGGIIGLEMATVYAALGSKIDIVERLVGLMPGTDRDLVRVWEKRNAPRFKRVMLGASVAGAEASTEGILVHFAGVDAAPSVYDVVLVAVGRRPNGERIGAAAAGIELDASGFVAVDRQMRTNVPHIFAIGDIAGGPMLAHKAVHEGHVAAEVASGRKTFFDAKQIPSVAYTDPEIAWCGKTEVELKAAGVPYDRAVFPWAASGRALANGREEGFTKLLFDATSGRVIGGAIVGTHAGDLIGEICLAIEMGADAADIGRTIHPHPTLTETVGMAAEVREGICTDLLPPRPASQSRREA